jgi:hypothetical protein
MLLVLTLVRAIMDLLPHVVLNAGATCGIAVFSMAGRWAAAYEYPDFELLPAQRAEIQFLLGVFIVLSAAAQVTGIVSTIGLGSVSIANAASASIDMFGVPPPGYLSDDARNSIGIVAIICCLVQVFGLLGAIICAATMGTKRGAWHEQLLSRYMRRELGF